MAELTATIITQNEEENIRECLESLTWVKEIVVVDSGSSDRTLEICRDYTDKVCINPWPGHQEQKNVAISLASHEWILSIDADERVPAELREAIERELCMPRYAGYWIARRNYFLGRWMRHGGWYPDRVLRLFDRRKGRFGGLNPHDRVAIADGSTGLLDGHLVHLTYRDFSQFIRKQDWYTEISAEGQVRRGRRPGSVTGAELLLRALVKFMQAYLLKRGFLDGMHGVIAAVGAAYFNVIKYAKIWECGLRTAESGQGAESQQERLLERHSAPAVTPLVRQDERTAGISVLVITRNEEENIQQCLESVSWADEIVVVDALSEDRTVEISRQFTDKVYLNPWPGFPAQRNFGLERVSGQWILILDADERVTSPVRDEIRACIAQADQDGIMAYQIPRRNYFFGRWLRWGGAFPDLQWRLFKRGFIRYDETTLDTPIVGGASGTLRNPIDHFTGRSIHQRLRKLDTETQIKARETIARRTQISWSDVTFRPMIAFLKVYLLKQGCRDGFHGLVFAALCGFYTFTRYVKAWELGRYLRRSG